MIDAGNHSFIFSCVTVQVLNSPYHLDLQPFCLAVITEILVANVA